MVIDKSAIIFLDQKNPCYNMYPVKFIHKSSKNIVECYDTNEDLIATINDKPFYNRLKVESLGYITLNKGSDMTIHIHKPINNRFTIIAMQYLDYKDDYKKFVGQHTYSLLAMDNNGKPPMVIADKNNIHDDKAVYIGTPSTKYGYIAKQSSTHHDTAKIRNIFHSEDYEKGMVRSLVYFINTDNVFYKKQENVAANILIYLQHPLYKAESQVNSMSTSKEFAYNDIPKAWVSDRLNLKVEGYRSNLTDYRGIWKDLDDDDFF